MIVSVLDRAQPRVIADRNRPQKHVERAHVVIASATGDPVQRVAAELDVSRPMVWRWQQRFAEAGMDGLLRDKTCKARQAAGRRRGSGADLCRAAA